MQTQQKLVETLSPTRQCKKNPKIGKWVPYELRHKEMEKSLSKFCFCNVIIIGDEKWNCFEISKCEKSLFLHSKASTLTARQNYFRRILRLVGPERNRVMEVTANSNLSIWMTLYAKNGQNWTRDMSDIATRKRSLSSNTHHLGHNQNAATATAPAFSPDLTPWDFL